MLLFLATGSQANLPCSGATAINNGRSYTENNWTNAQTLINTNLSRPPFVQRPNFESPGANFDRARGARCCCCCLCTCCTSSSMKVAHCVCVRYALVYKQTGVGRSRRRRRRSASSRVQTTNYTITQQKNVEFILMSQGHAKKQPLSHFL